MVGLLTRRVFAAILILLGVTALTFLLMQMVPGDPVRGTLGMGATKEAVAELTHELGLDRPLVVQYVDYMGNLVSGDLGQSLTKSSPVSTLLLPKLANTLILTAGSLLLCLLVGIPLGVLAGRWQYSLIDRASMFVSLAGASVPVYWAGLVLVYIFSIKLGLLPTSGKEDLRGDGGFVDLLAHLILPALTAAVVPMAVIARMARGAMVEALQGDHIKMLRASGLPEHKVVWKHAFRNTLPPVVNIIGLQVGYLLGGVIFVEVVFAWPGLGLQLYTDITSGDIPMLQAGILFVAAVFVVVNLLTDVTVALLDPRTRKAH